MVWAIMQSRGNGVYLDTQYYNQAVAWVIRRLVNVLGGQLDNHVTVKTIART